MLEKFETPTLIFGGKYISINSPRTKKATNRIRTTTMIIYYDAVIFVPILSQSLSTLVAQSETIFSSDYYVLGYIERNAYAHCAQINTRKDAVPVHIRRQKNKKPITIFPFSLSNSIRLRFALHTQYNNNNIQFTKCNVIENHKIRCEQYVGGGHAAMVDHAPAPLLRQCMVDGSMMYFCFWVSRCSRSITRS